jgi:2-polyprenyl-6-methoxyphenol hydroxylase-like FAD-dependent oxidoreductase
VPYLPYLYLPHIGKPIPPIPPHPHPTPHTPYPIPPSPPQVLTSGEIRTKNLPVANGSAEKYWVPRSALLDVLLQRVSEVNQAQASQTQQDTSPPIKLLFDTQCSTISHLPDGKIVIKTQRGRGEGSGGDFEGSGGSGGEGGGELGCDFLLGCDGINSGETYDIRHTTYSLIISYTTHHTPHTTHHTPYATHPTLYLYHMRISV